MDDKDVLGLKVLIESDRDRRALDFLIRTCGFARVRKASEELPGRTRPYVSNIAKLLGIEIPAEVQATARDEARQRISELKDRLATKKWT